MSRSAVLAIALAAIGAPAALPAEPRSAPGNTTEGRPNANTPPIQIQVIEPGGFHWQDAAVGSVAGIGFTLVVGGLAVAARHE